MTEGLIDDEQGGMSNPRRRSGLKFNVDKSKMMVLGEEEVLGCEICVDGA